MAARPSNAHPVILLLLLLGCLWPIPRHHAAPGQVAECVPARFVWLPNSEADLAGYRFWCAAILEDVPTNGIPTSAWTNGCLGRIATNRFEWVDPGRWPLASTATNDLHRVVLAPTNRTELGPGMTNWTHWGLQPSARYAFWLTAFNLSGLESDPSEVIVIAVPAVPTESQSLRWPAR